MPSALSVWNNCSRWTFLLGHGMEAVRPSSGKKTQEGYERDITRGEKV